MKNQYVGDINDYRKYGLIRALAGEDADDFRVGVFWMLTANDNRNDGNILDYLSQPKNWEHHDPLLFENLHSIIHKHRQRNVALIQSLNIIPSATFASCPLPDNAALRNDIVLSALGSFAGHELVFFDPDNGLEVSSKPLGCKDSNKYLYFSEVTQTFRRGHSLLIYQHFPRIQRDEYIALRTNQLRKATGAQTIFSFSTGFVCFFLVSQKEKIGYFTKRLEVVRNRWGDQFNVRKEEAR